MLVIRTRAPFEVTAKPPNCGALQKGRSKGVLDGAKSLDLALFQVVDLVPFGVGVVEVHMVFCGMSVTILSSLVRRLCKMFCLYIFIVCSFFVRRMIHIFEM